MITLAPITLTGYGVQLEPLETAHHDDVMRAAEDGTLWKLWFTSVPAPDETTDYITTALAGQHAGTMLPWVVRDLVRGEIVGSTRYHDIVAEIGRVEIGYTWYGATAQRTHVNSACKLLLLGHAFETLGCGVVGLRTDVENASSRRAIAAIGAIQDGIIRHQMRRRDGSIRDTVMFSIIAGEWPRVRDALLARLARHAEQR